jgi:hypothetical protein
MLGPHIVSQIKHSELETDSTLHVVGVIQNAVRFHSRYRLFREWAAEMSKTRNVELHVVEATYGDRAPECAPENGEYNYLRVKTHSEIWLKENLINIGIRNLLPHNWKYVAWVDCDVHFRDPNWALATVHQLQHYNIVQPWRSASDLDFHGNVMNTWTSFGSLCASGKPMCHDKTKEHLGYSYAHTGYAVACTRYFYENVSKLADFNIVGAGDHLMLWSCVDKVDATMPKNISVGYRTMCDDWGRKAFRACAGLVGFTPGRIEHNWHGSKVKRQYWSRWDILTKNNYDPTKDICYDSQGVLQLCGTNKYKIEHEIMRYNRSRMEDDIRD